MGVGVLRSRGSLPGPLARPLADLLTAVLMAGTLGCSAARVENVPLEQYERGAGYGGQFKKIDHGQDLRVVLAFSGGGTRASALSYGVLKELRASEVKLAGEKTPLIDQVSMISSVSGGSFTAAYYGLYGDRIFEDYEERFLKFDIDARLAVNLLRPIKLTRIMLTSYTRTDMAADLYDKYLFGGKTFADLEAADGPLLSINATDLDVGHVFSFWQPGFNMICSDLSKMRVSTAVTASSSVPGVFTPTVIKNSAGTCGYPRPQWIDQALADPSASRRRAHQAQMVETMLDSEKRPYLFLVDGGIADNIGARRIIDNAIEAGGIFTLTEAGGIEVPRHLLMIVVNAQAAHRDWAKSPRAPSVGRTLSAISGVGIYNYNFETMELLRESAARWARDAAAHGIQVTPHIVEIAFDNLKDPEERKFFNSVKTSFNLDDATVDRLIEVGGRLLRESPEYQKFLASMN